MPLENIAKQENRGNGILKYTEKTTGSLSVFLRETRITSTKYSDYKYVEIK